MSSSDVTCPKCGQQFELNEAVRIAVETRLRTEVEQQFRDREEVARRTAECQTAELQQKINDLQVTERLANEREAGLLEKQRDAELQTTQRELALQRKLDEELATARRVMEETLERRTQQQVLSATDELRAELEQQRRGDRERTEREVARRGEEAAKSLTELRQEVDGLRAAESEILRRARELEARERGLELDLERRLDVERRVLREEGARDALERSAREHQTKVVDLEADLVHARDVAVKAEAREAEARAAQTNLELRHRELEIGEAARLAAARKEAGEEATKIEAARLESEFVERSRRASLELDSARKQRELALQKEAEALDLQMKANEKLASFDVDLKRRVLEEQTKMHELAAKEREAQAVVDAQRRELDEQESQERLRQATRIIADLQQKLTQRSMQVQGEAQERALRDLISEAFVGDELDDVPIGVGGADLLHHVCDESGARVGTIIWESKRTKNWLNDWLPKLRTDARATDAVIAVIVTQALPDGIRSFAERDGVWVCAWPYVTALASVLRGWVIEVARSHRAAEGRSDKIQLLYGYLTGPQFRLRFEGIVEAYQLLRGDLDEEKRATLRRWKKREHSLDRALTSLADLHGELDSIVGKKLEGFPVLTFGAGDDEHEDELIEGLLLTALPAGVPVPRHKGGSAIDEALVALFDQLLPEDGTTVGNQTMRVRFADEALTRLGRQVSEVDYLGARAVLEARGVLRRGQGRGGTVGRIPAQSVD